MDYTINDIAEEAGVSRATVSRVMNNPEIVKPETRRKILDIIDKSNYKPSAVARSLSLKTTNAVGVIVPKLDNPFYGQIIMKINNVLKQNGASILCFNSDFNVDEEMQALVVLKQNRVKGVFYVSSIEMSNEKEQAVWNQTKKTLDIPIVLVDCKVDDETDGVYFDDYDGVYKAVQFFAGRGHRKIGIINGMFDKYFARLRQEAYEQAMRDLHIDVNPKYIYDGNYDEGRTYHIAKEMLLSDDHPTAIITCSKRTSFGFTRAMHELRSKVQKVDCIGLDRVRELEMIGMPFKCIDRSPEEMGEVAVQILESRLRNPDQPTINVTLATHLCTFDENGSAS